MGTFGNEIFQDDLALDIKDNFESLLEEGLEVEEIVDTIISEFEDSFEDFDEAPTAVVALATLVVENGFVSERLKDELTKVENEKEYWEYLKEENLELCKNRLEAIKKLKSSLI